MRGLVKSAPDMSCYINILTQPYAKKHCHPDHDEIGLVIGSQGALEYEMILDGKEHRVQFPAAFSIPAGTYTTGRGRAAGRCWRVSRRRDAGN